MKYAKWRIAPERPDAQARLTAAGYPYLVSAVLAGRGVDTPEQAAAFLEREQSLAYSPFLMKDMDKAAARVQQALTNNEKIAVFGDYDVDGITATCILVDYLQSRGADVVHYIPRRIEDGYGLSCDAIECLRPAQERKRRPPAGARVAVRRQRAAPDVVRRGRGHPRDHR